MVFKETSQEEIAMRNHMRLGVTGDRFRTNKMNLGSQGEREEVSYNDAHPVSIKYYITCITIFFRSLHTNSNNSKQKLLTNLDH